MKYTPKMPLSIEAKKIIIDALINHINRWGTRVDDEPLSEDAIIELNRIALDVNKHYLKTKGYKKYEYPLISKNYDNV